ncbi:alpha/beta hydrolase, partial [Marinobacter salsuginis]|uniref:alpha/beta hydrolase n=1 Tax=Marinobacter salsuginis TaxID=418719 RepID=UPI00273F6FBB
DRRGDQPTGYATPSTCFHTPEITITHSSFASVNPERIGCPILMIAGTEDRITPIKVQRRIAQHYGNQAELVEIPGCCHWTIGGSFFPHVSSALFTWLELTCTKLSDSA